MGCASSLPRKGTIRVKIEYELKSEREIANCNKILMLGPGESGKSTIVKQMRIIHGAGYSETERKYFRETVHMNAFQGLDIILQAVQDLQISFEMDESVSFAKKFAELKQSNLENGISNEIGNLMINLWKDKGVRKCFARSSEYQLSDSVGYFLNNLMRLCEPDYIPTQHDVLQARVCTTGINEYRFICKEIHFMMVDVGGQKSQRRKWLHCFDDVTGIIFCVAISEYDTYLEDDHQMTKMTDSINLFQTICINRWLGMKPMILFLNKTDLLMEKILHSPLKNFYPEYDGPNTYGSAVVYLKNMFIFHTESKHKMDNFVHLTCAIDTENIERVFDIASEMIITANQKECGLF